MDEKAKVPAIRFKGFTDAWEQRKFSDTFIYLQSNSLSRADLNYEQGIVKNIHYGDVLIKFGEILDVEKAEIPFISNNNFNVNSTSLLQNGDVVIADAAEDETVGKCSEIIGVAGISIVSGLHTIPCRPNKTFGSGYLGFYLNSSAYHDQLLPLIQGTKISSISKSALRITDIIYPKLEQEQLQIGRFFQSLDNLITLHQRKLLKLKNVKKAMLEKMFPKNGNNVPEIRFRGFTDAWELRKWSETVDISAEMVDPKCGEYDNLPHVAPGNIESFTGRVLDNVKTVKEETLISGKFHFYTGDVIYGKINPQLGKYVFAEYEGLTSADAYVFNSKNGLDQKFLFTLIQSNDYYRYTVSVSMRSGMPKINRDELNKFSYFSPSIDEQSQIGELFITLDNLITLHQRKVEKLKNIKKACLENMFV